MKLVNKDDVRRFLGNASTNPNWNTTTDKATAKKVLEHEWVFCNGLIRDICVKYLGLGVYKIYTQERP